MCTLLICRVVQHRLRAAMFNLSLVQVGTHQQGTPAIQWEPMLFGGFKLTSPT